MALPKEVTDLFEKHVKRHGYLTNEMKVHLHRGYTEEQISEKELKDLGDRIKEHVADRKGQPDYEDAVNALKRLQRDGLSLEPHAALDLLLKRIPKTQTKIARVVSAIARVRHVKPTPTRPWHAIEKSDRGVMVVTADRDAVKRIRPNRVTYNDYMERMLRKTRFQGSTTLNNMPHDLITRFLPNRTELFHLYFPPKYIYKPRYIEGTKKVPELVIEPLINVSEEDREEAATQLRRYGHIRVGELIGHRVHVFEQHNQSQAEKLARKMSRFFRHDVEVVRHYR